jgi:TRAP-type mannitol/chloroaromatic compound transport system permease small subunit
MGTAMKNILRFIDSISLWNARIFQWLCVGLILLLSYEVTMRYVFNDPTIWVMQTSMMVGGTIIVMGWSYVHQQRAHVRVDVIYGRLSVKWQSLVNTLGAVVFFFPFVGFLLYQAVVQAMYSLKMGERMSETAWYPPVFPMRMVVVIGLSLFMLQGIAQFIRDVQTLTTGEAND